MKLGHLIMIFFAAAASLSGQPNQESRAPIGPALQAAMEGSTKNSGAIGVSAAVVFPTGEMWAGTTGVSHAGVPLTTDMLFGIASVQKNLQAALALKLIEEGAFGLDDPLRKWIPPTAALNGAITVRQVLNMTSGIKDFVGHPKSPFRVGYVNIDFEHNWTWQEIQDVFIDKPSFQPGTGCEYSSTNYIVLKQIIEKAARSKQSKLAEDRLLKPNRLDHTWVDFSRPVPERMRVAHGWFDTNDDGSPEDISGDSLNWIASLAPMLVYSTPSDVAKWLDALYHRKSVLKEQTLKAMLDFGGPVQGEPLMKGYGLGVVDINVGAILPRWAHVRIYGHLGSGFGYMTFAGYLPDYGVSLAIMSNRGGDTDSERAIGTVGGAVIDALLRHLESLHSAGMRPGFLVTPQGGRYNRN
jgi:D-alanyl-D-alanine carboxypeptidase